MGLILLAPLFIIVFVVGLFDTGSPIFLQQRVGVNKKPFTLIKFRTMTKETESVATHLVDAGSVTKFGSLLRRSKLDELPQLINVLKGDMSFVGPRPCLFLQGELIDERASRGVYRFKPGITGLAQINGIDMSTPQLLAEWDQKMMNQLSLMLYFYLILRTIFGAGSGDRVNF